MPGILWNQLAPINPPQVMGQIAPQQASSLNSLAGGVMEGVAQADAMKTNAMQRAQTQQTMDQRQALFPGQLEAQQLGLEKGRMELTSLQEAREYAQQLKTASKQSEGQYINTLNPVDKVSYLKGKADLQKTVAEISGIETQSTKVGLDNYHAAISNIGQTFNAASQGRTPEEKQKIFGMAMGMLPEPIQKIMTDKGMNEYNDQNAAAAMQLATEERANWVLQHAKDLKPSSKMQNARRIAELKAGISSGTATNEDRDELQSLQQQTTPPKLVNNPTDIAIAKSEEENLKKINDRKQGYQQVTMAADGALQALEKTPETVLNPVSSFFKAGKLNPNAQVLESFLNRLTLISKGQYNMGSQGFTDADRKFVQAINGDLSNYKGTLKELLETSKSFSEHAAQQDWLTEYSIQKKGSDQGQSWLQDNPEPSATIIYKNQVGQVPMTRLNEYIKNGAKVK